MNITLVHTFVFILLFFASMAHSQFATIDTISPIIHKTYPHKTYGYTQGFFFMNEYLVESTGLFNQSYIFLLDTNNLHILKKRPIEKYFAEGSTLFHEKIFQITWKAGKAVVLNPETLNELNIITYEGEGWGLTNNSNYLIMSNGSDTLYFRNENFEIIKKISVSSQQMPIRQLNELEWVHGKIYANIYQSPFIIEIDPKNGNVTRWFDCSKLIEKEGLYSSEFVLNGIAHHPQRNTFFLTGKRWKYIYEVYFSETSPHAP